MKLFSYGDPLPAAMVKDSVAALLREQIISGRLNPGERIVEAKWAAEYKVAQASIREALNILANEGFVQKGAGRSARVTELSEEDVVQIFQVRAALESLAARLIAEKRPDLADLEQTISDMHAAAECNNVRAFYERDLRFHMLLCERSGNRFLAQEIKRFIVPLFAFVVMRLHAPNAGPAMWRTSVEEHRRILDVLRHGDPDLAERYLVQTIRKFCRDTHDILTGETAEPAPEPTA